MTAAVSSGEKFQSTLPARGATAFRCGQRCGRAISIHAPRTGSDWEPPGVRPGDLNFNPRSPHGERPAPCGRPLRCGRISIHAPRTGSDVEGAELDCALLISIHAPRTGSDDVPADEEQPSGEFQSTLPARGATRCPPASRPSSRNFNPRSPHGERPQPRWFAIRDLIISIHAPRTGSDPTVSPRQPLRSRFQSTLPARGATFAMIHVHTSKTHFNPRSPHGERHQLVLPCYRQ